MGVAIGIVLGGTQALSRSAFSQLIPKGREAEYFSLYQAGERGTSWLGTLVFGLVHQLTGSYRPAIVALGLFFVVGLVLLSRVDMRRGITEAGNTQPTHRLPPAANLDRSCLTVERPSPSRCLGPSSSP